MKKQRSSREIGEKSTVSARREMSMKPAIIDEQVMGIFLG